MSSAAPAVVLGRHRATEPVRFLAPRPAAPGTRPAAPEGPRRPGAERSLLSRVTGLLLSLLMVASVLSFLALAVGPHVFGYRTSTMLTGSMEPGIAPGDVVVTVPRPATEVEVGDVISYHIPVEDHRVETHRVTEVVEGEDGSVAVRTKGDANANVDPWTATVEGDTVWEVVAVVPEVGNAIRLMREPFIRQGLLWVALGATLVLGMAQIWSREADDDDLPRGEER